MQFHHSPDGCKCHTNLCRSESLNEKQQDQDPAACTNHDTVTDVRNDHIEALYCSQNRLSTTAFNSKRIFQEYRVLLERLTE